MKIGLSYCQNLNANDSFNLFHEKLMTSIDKNTPEKTPQTREKILDKRSLDNHRYTKESQLTETNVQGNVTIKE